MMPLQKPFRYGVLTLWRIPALFFAWLAFGARNMSLSLPCIVRTGIGAGDFSGVNFIDSDSVNICIVGILKSPAL